MPAYQSGGSREIWVPHGTDLSLIHIWHGAGSVWWWLLPGITIHRPGGFARRAGTGERDLLRREPDDRVAGDANGRRGDVGPVGRGVCRVPLTGVRLPVAGATYPLHEWATGQAPVSYTHLFGCQDGIFHQLIRREFTGSGK